MQVTQDWSLPVLSYQNMLSWHLSDAQELKERLEGAQESCSLKPNIQYQEERKGEDTEPLGR